VSAWPRCHARLCLQLNPKENSRGNGRYGVQRTGQDTPCSCVAPEQTAKRAA
jgi:hypothetical protein